LQLGVVDVGAALRASAAGITVIMDRCTAIEYRRLFADEDVSRRRGGPHVDLTRKARREDFGTG
jgi:hypothetical protein